MVRCGWVWGWMLARVCLHSLCFRMRCRGKVSEEALHVASGCEAFHLETNAFPLQRAFSLLGICVYTSVSEIKICKESKTACVCASAGSVDHRQKCTCYTRRMEKCVRALTASTHAFPH